MRRRAWASALAALTVASLLTGCVSWFQGNRAPTTSTPTLEQVDAALEPFYHQVVSWTGCGGGLQCASVTAPMDWDDPAGATISLALARQYATGGEPRGSLLVNPGGPGASGVEFVRESLDYSASEALRREYSVVGFDPRGVGASTAVSCASDSRELDAFFYGDLREITAAPEGSDEWIAASRAEAQAFGSACLEHTGDLLAHVDTVSAARDLDLLRAVLGDEKLTYLGFSYGTYLGATYAELFPDRAGRLVLDGAIDPSTSEADVTLTQARGFEAALDAYLTDCLGREGCPFSGSVEAARATIADLLAQLDENPPAAEDGRLLWAGTMTTAIILPLYNESNWTFLDDLFSETLDGGTETAFFLADYYNDRGAGGRYTSNSSEAFVAINCLDYASDGDPERMRAQAAVLAAEAPIFGPWMSYGGTTCAEWPFVSDKERREIHAPGAPDILVVGTTGDPATPYEWAVALADQLDRGHLVTFQGEGHTAYAASECVTDVVDAFLISGTVPADDPMC
ncbi:alpha/beta hydrolase [Salinibacterium sp. ZJ70]|uniref:alpha/beta hydrolase n=1 Tax=Salinibacterium sp. ZJ70 TaxID=2708084 RepID=UPI0014203B27|nr:alpha/beta hydrolase [Salinibacterium sp. ZJ70]